MAREIEGRWRLEFEGQALADPTGNEFILFDGIVILAQTARAFGTYEVDGDWLILKVPMPTISDETPCKTIVRLIAPSLAGGGKTLPGLADAVTDDGVMITTKACRLVRLGADG